MPLPFRPGLATCCDREGNPVSIPNGMPLPFRPSLASHALGASWFHSPTGCLFLSDERKPPLNVHYPISFNPQRDASSFQTRFAVFVNETPQHVSIPNGMPLPFRR